MSKKPPVEVTLQWTHDLVFETTVAAGRGPVLDGDSVAGASPPQALALALGACMGIDVVSILQKGRHDLRGLTVAVAGTRADEPPSYFTSFTLHYAVTGPVPDAAIQRAIDSVEGHLLLGVAQPSPGHASRGVLLARRWLSPRRQARCQPRAGAEPVTSTGCAASPWSS